MNHHEQHEQPGNHKMNGSGGLTPAKQVEKPGHASIRAGRHGQARKHDQRQHEEYDGKVGKLLKAIVPRSLLPTGKSEPKMVDQRPPDLPQLPSARQEIAPKMPGKECVEQINTPVDYEQPGEKEMPDAPGRKVLPPPVP